MGNLSKAQRSELTKMTALKPDARKKAIYGVIRTIANGIEKDNDWKLEVSEQLTNVPGRCFIAYYLRENIFWGLSN